MSDIIVPQSDVKLCTRNVNLYYGENHALKDINLDIKTNKITAFIGPSGCGKSTFMRRTTAAMEERGLESVYIHCSGDPDSLDGVIFPAIGTAIVDGTAPHGMDTLGHRCAYLSCSACSSCMSA